MGSCSHSIVGVAVGTDQDPETLTNKCAGGVTGSLVVLEQRPSQILELGEAPLGCAVKAGERCSFQLLELVDS